MQSYSSCRWTWDSLTNVELWMTNLQNVTDSQMTSYTVCWEEAGSQGLMPDCVY